MTFGVGDLLPLDGCWVVVDGAAVPRCLLVVKTVAPSFHDGTKMLQRRVVATLSE